MDNQNNNNCNCNTVTPMPMSSEDINMNVCGKNINMLPMLQTYTTKLLKPNMQCDKNVLTQCMMSCENYKYVICWDFDLRGKIITVPENCILEFDGGSLKNGTIIGQDTVFINVGDVDIWGENLIREGTWREHSGGISIDVDDHLSEDSENPVQNKVITENILALIDGINNNVHDTSDVERRLRQDMEALNDAVDGKLEDTLEDVQNAINGVNDNIDGLSSSLQDEISERDLEDTRIESNLRNLSENLRLNYYDKDEVDSIVSNTPETDVIVTESLDNITQETIGGEPNPEYIAPADRENKLFMIPGPDNTSFTEYAWNSKISDFVALDIKDYGIDDEPEDDSPNTVKSGGVARLIKGDENTEKFYLADKTGAIVAVLSKDDLFALFTDLRVIGNIKAEDIEVEDINAEDIEAVNMELDSLKVSGEVKIRNGNAVVQTNEENDNDFLTLFDKSSAYILDIDNNKKKHGAFTEKSVYDLNVHKDSEMHSACEYNCSKVPDTQIIVCTDTHENYDAFERFVQAVNDFESVTCGLYLGDIINYHPTYNKNIMDRFSEIIRNSKKPIFFVAGNHDVGHSHRAIPCCSSDKQLYNWFIKPAVDNHWLVNTEYQEGGQTIVTRNDYSPDKMYYCREFADGTLLIVLYQYDDGNVLSSQDEECTDVIDYVHWGVIPYNPSYDDYDSGTVYSIDDCVNMPGTTDMSFKSGSNNNTGNAPKQTVTDNVYWRPITYNPNYPNLVTQTSISPATTADYTVGDRVNILNYTEYSFECVKNVTIKGINLGLSSGNLNTEQYECYPKYKAIRSWSWYSRQQLVWFCDKLKYAASKDLKVVIATHMPYSAKTEEITESPFSLGKDVSYGSYQYRNNYENWDVIAEIINAWVNKGRVLNIRLAPIPSLKYLTTCTILDNTSSIQSFYFSYNFNDMETPNNDPVKHPIIIGGHFHDGGMLKHKTYEQKQLLQDTGAVFNYNYTNNGVGKSFNLDNICFDRMNVLTILGSKLHVSRLGSDYVKKNNDESLVSRDNVIINF